MGVTRGNFGGLAALGKLIGHFVLLIIRLYWGFLLFNIGLGKLLNVHETAQFFTSLQIPLPLFSAYLVGVIELIGGITFFFGFFARFWAIPLFVVFVVTYLTAHTEALTSFFINPSLFITQDPFLFLYATILIFCFGSGAISIDYWIERKQLGHNP